MIPYVSLCTILLLLSVSSCNAWIVDQRRPATTSSASSTRSRNRPMAPPAAIGGQLASSTSSQRHTQFFLYTTQHELSNSIIDDKDVNDDDFLYPPHRLLPSRRQWLLAAGSTAVLLPSAIAHAAVVTTPATCDATVSVFQRGNRILYLLGTAHISQISADLARQLVRDAHPNAVFVELDLKRVGGLLRTPNKAIEEYVPEDSLTATSSSNNATPRIIVPLSRQVDSADDSVSSMVPAPRKQEEPQPNWFQRQLLGWAAASVGKALKGMYNNLGESGFSPGEEFRVAMEEAREIDATIVLGDQDVEITLQRLTQALGRTDFKSLQTTSPDLEDKLSGLLGTNALPPVREDFGSADEFKAELSAYVERLKSRENVRAIMASLKEVAPALVQVMLTERDMYMAKGLDALNDYDVTVAVMGIAHQDGVEANLRDFGWKNVELACK